MVGGARVAWTPSGSSASRSLSDTICRETFSSASKANVKSITDRPKIVLDLREITLGTVLSARSMGTVTCCSTSSGAWPGCSATTVTCMSEMSG